ncbi:HD domain-containing protein [Nocardioides sp.]|uniref:HD domain-containing protein n=1 Tax=Nocardioides sp. TaxID=35761 RepID=UPI002D1BCCF4|nr:HD domain-containing protein [Nocardioides sp.]HXH79970.1 HD domain-containing protein [Nocardioides sp.]
MTGERTDGGGVSDLVARAKSIATQAHEGTDDKAGAPYIAHPARVARRVAGHGEEFEAAAWLHDVMEDCEGWTAERLLARGMTPPVVEAVVSLTNRPGEEHEEAVRRACQDPIGMVVKASDVADNGDPERLAKLPDEQRTRLTAKYAHAREVLDELGAPRFDR